MFIKGLRLYETIFGRENLLFKASHHSNFLDFVNKLIYICLTNQYFHTTYFILQIKEYISNSH